MVRPMVAVPARTRRYRIRITPADGKSTAERMQDKATQVPNQRRAWPTTVTNTAGPTSPAGPGSAQDRKGTVIEASGPQQGVIRNRW